MHQQYRHSVRSAPRHAKKKQLYQLFIDEDATPCHGAEAAAQEQEQLPDDATRSSGGAKAHLPAQRSEQRIVVSSRQHDHSSWHEEWHEHSCSQASEFTELNGALDRYLHRGNRLLLFAGSGATQANEFKELNVLDRYDRGLFLSGVHRGDRFLLFVFADRLLLGGTFLARDCGVFFVLLVQQLGAR